MGTSGLMSIELGLRDAVVALCLLIAALALRDRRDSTAALLGAALAIGAAASMICSTPTFPRPFAWWGLLLLVLSSANCATEVKPQTSVCLQCCASRA